MSERVVQRLDFQTGRITEKRGHPEPGTIAERLQGLLAEMSEHSIGPPIVTHMRIVCDGCGASVEITEAEPLPFGWVSIMGRGEFCLDCRDRDMAVEQDEELGL